MAHGAQQVTKKEEMFANLVGDIIACEREEDDLPTAVLDNGSGYMKDAHSALTVIC